jgi:hypothetical protein
MAKTQTIAAGVPIPANSAGLGDDWLCSINEYLLDEHVMTGALGYLIHRPGSAKVWTSGLPIPVAGLPPASAFPSGAPAATDTGKLALVTTLGVIDGPLYEYDFTVGAYQRIIGGRYATTGLLPGNVAQVIAAATFTTITGFNIAAFNLNAGLDYRIRANACLQRTAGAVAQFGVRVRVTEFGGVFFDYEQPIWMDAVGATRASINFDCIHNCTTGGVAAIAFQAWGNVAWTLNSTLAALAGWTLVPNNSLDIMEI